MGGAFRRFRVARKLPESSVITSFHLTPADGGPLWDMRPGQYLTLRIPLAEGPVLRTYSLSCPTEGRNHHRISVKREPQGAGSGWLHDRVSEGDVIEIAAPRGSFCLDQTSERPVLLLAGGVGLTPLLAMLHALAQTSRRVWFIHAVENGEVQALRDEVAALADVSGGLITALNVYRTPSEQDRATARFDAEGVIDRALLQSTLPLDDYEVYLCGPTPFMVAMWRVLTGLGIAPARIAYEFFGKGGSLAALAATPAPLVQADRRMPTRAPQSLSKLDFITDPDARALPERPAQQGLAPADGASEVVFARSGVTVPWSDAATSILELAEGAGLAPAFSCREGICSTCSCRIDEGSVDYFSDPLDSPRPGQVLICCSRPTGRVVLDL